MTMLGILVSMITYTAQQARQRFGEILDLVKYKGETIQVTRAGRVAILITAPPVQTSKVLTSDGFAGSWTDEFARKVTSRTKKFRKSFALSR